MRREKSSTSRRVLITALFIAIIGGISFGYAQLRETLTINGSATIKSVKWNVNLRNLALNDADPDNNLPRFLVDPANVVEITKGNDVVEELVYDTTTDPSNPTVTVRKNAETGGLVLHFQVGLKEPNQRFSFTFDISNDGTLDAELTGIKEDGVSVQHVTNNVVQKVSATATEPYFKYTVSGMPALDATNTISLNKGTKRTVTVTFEYPDLTDAANLSTTDFVFEKTIELVYSQK